LPNGSADSAAASTPLLQEGESPSWSALRAGAASPLVLIGDHSGRAIPRGLADLGLTPAALDRHIACDIGISSLGAALSQALGATFIAQRYSRLVIDCNRDPARADSICEVSDGVDIPGNRSLEPAARARRIAEVFEPYHAAITAELEHRLARGERPRLVSLHSFTPVMDDQPRPWRFGVLHLGGSAFSDEMLSRLRGALGEALVGDNQPYSMDGTDYTVPHHAIARGLDYLELEVRQDTIADPAGVAEIAALLAPLLGDAAGPPA
jgi:predicted N-formylglutamate amidohydrolase